MNYSLVVMAHNCCSNCSDSCMIVGRPTFFGFVIILGIALIGAIIVYCCPYSWFKK